MRCQSEARSKALRELYDLPAQKLQAASFEVSFRSPFAHPSLFDSLPPSELEEDKSIIDRICEHLQLGLAWLGNDLQESFLDDKKLDPALKNRILEAMKYLTPPTTGAIQKTQVSGRAFKVDRAVELDRSDRRRVIMQQKKISGDETPKGFEGAGTIVDILGDDAEICVEFTSGSITGQRSCKFNDELWETYGKNFHYHQVIRVFGVTSSLKEPITVLEIGFPDENDEQQQESE